MLWTTNQHRNVAECWIKKKNLGDCRTNQTEKNSSPCTKAQLLFIFIHTHMVDVGPLGQSMIDEFNPNIDSI